MGGGDGDYGGRKVSSDSFSGSGYDRSDGVASAEEENRKRETQTKLTDYINKEGVDKVRKIVSIYDPSLGTVIRAAQFVYENREELIEAYSEINQTWNSDASLGEKIVDTASTVIHTTATIIKKEGMTSVVKLAAKGLSNTAVSVVEEEGIFDKVDSALNIPGAGSRFKDLLKDTIEKETEKSLSRIVGE